MLTTLSRGTVLAFLLTGLILGAFTRSENVNGSPILLTFAHKEDEYGPGRLRCKQSRRAGRKSRWKFDESGVILLCDVRKRTLQTQYINQPGRVSNNIISKGPSAMSASPGTRAIPALMGSFPRAQPCGYA